MMGISDNVGDDSVTSEGASQPVQWAGAMNPLKWTFLQEPVYKWAAFFVAMSLFATAWKGVLRYMK